MTQYGIQAIKTLREEVLNLGQSLTLDDWARPSACAGWSVQDILIHLNCTLREVVSPDSLPAPVAGDIEASNDVGVAAFRGQTPEETLAEYRSMIDSTIDELAQLQVPPASESEVDMDNAGVYPAHLLVDSLVFDHYCHLRHDIIAPHGPVEAATVEPDEDIVKSSLAWLLAGLPQMSPERLGVSVTAPVRLSLTGVGGGDWLISPEPGKPAVAPDDRVVQPAAIITSDADDFIRWGTKRATETERARMVTLSGDRELGQRVVESIHVF
ncbi:TIGR03083 family protein [Arthrobacter sp. cf158]|uniref:maleylpyruvate isomerase family mycothiol-dependent enzyme n=1 Tax=Arthrobacter sp. cf158 TaxID=1761744 RepID=UPI0008961C9E|nr:maleylpyruvate isomerase family mycothiol-dependent enzyme [Arthrobacter sp. cf158]SDW91299.1 TIGR03083 family protein [Arthrobacter sp. cf158]